VQYFANITLGEQTLPAIYDTGSFEILTLSVRCPKCKLHASKNAPLYDHVVSTTYVGEGTRVEHVFGSGPVISQRGFENIMIGDKADHANAKGSHAGLHNGPVINKMDFWQIEDHQISAWEAGARFSAIVGLGPQDTVPPLTASAQAETTDTLLQRSGVDDFSICLQRKSTPEQLASRKFPPGWLAFNAPPSKKADMKVDVVGKVHWGVKMNNFGISGDPSKTNVCANGCGAIVDSGTSLIAAPQEVLMQMEGFLSQVKQDCSNIDELPNLEFSLGEGKKTEFFSLPPRAYVMKVTNADIADTSIWDWVMGTPKIKIVNTCMPAFMPLDKHSQFGPVFILGMPFLRYYKTTFVRSQPPQMFFDAVDKTCEPLPDAVVEEQQAAIGTDAMQVVQHSKEEVLKQKTQSKQILLDTVTKKTGMQSWTAAKASKLNAELGRDADDVATPMDVDLNDLLRPRWAMNAKEEDVVL